MNSSFEESDIFDEIEQKSSDVTVKDVDGLIEKEKLIKQKAKTGKSSKYGKLFYQVRLILELLKDYRAKKYTDIPWKTIGILTLIIIYFINPFDIIPDVLPLLGFADDALLFAAFINSISGDLKKYSNWKGYDTGNYF